MKKKIFGIGAGVLLVLLAAAPGILGVSVGTAKTNNSNCGCSKASQFTSASLSVGTLKNPEKLLEITDNLENQGYSLNFEKSILISSKNGVNIFVTPSENSKNLLVGTLVKNNTIENVAIIETEQLNGGGYLLTMTSGEDTYYVAIDANGQVSMTLIPDDIGQDFWNCVAQCLEWEYFLWYQWECYLPCMVCFSSPGPNCMQCIQCLIYPAIECIISCLFNVVLVEQQQSVSAE